MSDIHFVGKIDLRIFKTVAENICSDEVIITDVQIKHIKIQHPNDYERYFKFAKSAVESPDYILEANKPNSVVILKSVEENGKRYKLILRLKTSADPINYKNSVITFLHIDEREWNRLINNKKYFTNENKYVIILVS